MAVTSLLFLFVALGASGAVIVEPDQIAKTVYLNDTTFVAYNASTSKCRIDCTDPETTHQENFRLFQKVWMFNNTEFFSADDKTFIDGNRSLEFQVLDSDDSGVYQCCIRSTDLAYQSFVCYSTVLTVVDELPDGLNETLATTEAPPSPSWNVILEDGATLNAEPEHNYFLRVFDDNVTDIHCLVNEVEAKIRSNNNFPAPLFNDILIQSFNFSDHSGVYVCNATLLIGNETFPESVSFTVSQSWNENVNAEMLDGKVVAEALKDAVAVVFSLALVVLVVVFVAF